jgi:hypothetical protein
MFIELIVSEIDARRVDENINPTRFSNRVEYHFAGSLSFGLSRAFRLLP